MHRTTSRLTETDGLGKWISLRSGHFGIFSEVLIACGVFSFCVYRYQIFSAFCCPSSMWKFFPFNTLQNKIYMRIVYYVFRLWLLLLGMDLGIQLWSFKGTSSRRCWVCLLQQLYWSLGKVGDIQFYLHMYFISIMRLQLTKLFWDHILSFIHSVKCVHL